MLLPWDQEQSKGVFLTIFILEAQASAVMQGRGIKGIKIKKGKKAHFSLFSDNMIVYKKNSRVKIRTLRTAAGKITGHKIEIRKLIIFLNTSAEQLEIEIKKSIPLKIAIKT